MGCNMIRAAQCYPSLPLPNPLVSQRLSVDLKKSMMVVQACFAVSSG
jgi:hypothetical protein